MTNTIFELQEGTLFINLPEGKTMKEINALGEQWFKDNGTSSFAGKDILLNGRVTYALAMLIEKHLHNVAHSILVTDPKQQETFTI